MTAAVRPVLSVVVYMRRVVERRDGDAAVHLAGAVRGLGGCDREGRDDGAGGQGCGEQAARASAAWAVGPVADQVAR
ncbi:hypothetical protein GCM10023221_12200 [Luteimicrobium xylanilyticum]|uniref:hypothetical protein n=1 Tax=Luteimicrobium xylanilyticum TaxID=1133546 RepID=UPI00055D016E|nr:hypothetical protein [Luteimicrobium xylanilyticum]